MSLIIGADLITDDVEDEQEPCTHDWIYFDDTLRGSICICANCFEERLCGEADLRDDPLLEMELPIF